MKISLLPVRFVTPLFAAATACLLTGCGTVGRIGERQYDRDPRPLADRGRIAVFFDPARPWPRPATEWRLVNADGPLDWQPVTQHPVFRTAPVDTYGIQFQICDPQSPAEPPPSGTVPVLEKQRLKIPISYR